MRLPNSCSVRCIQISLFLLAAWLAVPVALPGQLSPADPVRAAPPPIADLRSGGLPAVRAWLAERSSSEKETRESVEERELSALFELTVYVQREQGGRDLLKSLLDEAERRLPAAQARASRAGEKARMAALLGSVYERLAGDPVSAQRWYQRALKLSAEDAVALEGLQRLRRREEVDAHKELEVYRLKELQAAFARGPDAVGPPPEPAPVLDPTAQP